MTGVSLTPSEQRAPATIADRLGDDDPELAAALRHGPAPAPRPVSAPVAVTAVLGVLSGAALMTAGAAALGLSPATQLIGCALAAAAAVVLLRPARYARPGR